MTPLQPGKGHTPGFAAHRGFLSYVAAVVEVEVDEEGGVRIPREELAIDCGRVVHPERVQAQFEGSTVFGASIALMDELTAEGRKYTTNTDIRFAGDHEQGSRPPGAGREAAQ